jgi:hypothetical protein
MPRGSNIYQLDLIPTTPSQPIPIPIPTNQNLHRETELKNDMRILQERLINQNNYINEFKLIHDKVQKDHQNMIFEYNETLNALKSQFEIEKKLLLDENETLKSQLLEFTLKKKEKMLTSAIQSESINRLHLGGKGRKSSTITK